MKPRRRPPAAKTDPSKTEIQAPVAEHHGWHSGLPPGIFIVLAVTAFYVWTATSSQYAFVWGTKKADHYNMLAEGFLSGHLYLAVDPPKELLALKDPLDPVANAPYRMHDVSFYNGHYYVYFGPVPVVTLYLPWRIITGWSIPNNLAVIIYLLAGYIFSCLLLFTLLAAAGIKPSWIQKRIAIAALGLCQTAPIILRRAYMYETAIAAGFCFLIAGFYFLARYVVTDEPRHWHGVIGGLCLGLTPGCRPNYAVVVAIAAVAYLVHFNRRGLTARAWWLRMYMFFLPIAFCGLMLAWYNYARFGNPLNVGQVYQLVGSTGDRGMTTKISNLLPGLYRLLLQAPVWVKHFPFLELANAGNFGTEKWPEGYDHIEPVSGLLLVSPLCLIGAGLPLFLWRFRSEIPAPVRFLLLTIYLTAMANLLAIVMTVNQVTQRYEGDFAPSLLVLSLFAILYFAARFEKLAQRIAVTSLMAAGVILTAIMQAALSINGYDNPLMERDVNAFNTLASFFGEDVMNTRRLVYGLVFSGDITFREQPAGKREALLTSGVPRRSDAIFIEYLNGGRVRLGAVMSGNDIVYGPAIPITPGKLYRMYFDYVPLPAHVTVSFDDAVVLNAPIYFYPTTLVDATVLRNDIGVPPNVEPFSGELNAPRGLQFASASSSAPK
jgi:hypothetical protein